MRHHTDRITNTTAFVTPIIPMKQINIGLYTLYYFHLLPSLLLSPLENILTNKSEVLFSLYWNIKYDSTQCSTTGATKAVVCAILSVG